MLRSGGRPACCPACPVMLGTRADQAYTACFGHVGTTCWSGLYSMFGSCWEHMLIRAIQHVLVMLGTHADQAYTACFGHVGNTCWSGLYSMFGHVGNTCWSGLYSMFCHVRTTCWSGLYSMFGSLIWIYLPGIGSRHEPGVLAPKIARVIESGPRTNYLASN